MVRLDDGPTVAVHASAQPHEFCKNEKLFYGCFWNLFPMQCGMPTAGSLAVERSRHMLTQYVGLNFPIALLA